MHINIALIDRDKRLAKYMINIDCSNQQRKDSWAH